jgi:anti-sigma factor RsiW
MTEPEAMPSDVHPEIALLPWYANGTLGDRERQQVGRHLESCDPCRRELEELRSMKRRLRETYEAQSAPSARLVRSVMADVAADVRARSDRPSAPSSWLHGMDQCIRALFLPRWVPTLAAALLIAQMGLLLRMGLPPTEPDQVSRRSLGMQTATIAVMFEASATEEQIRVLLQQVRGEITHGPTAEGFYTIEVLSTDGSTTQRKVDLLSARTDIVRSADLVKP